MKTQFNQILIVVGFFTMSITTTLAISWGMTEVLHDSRNGDSTHTTFIIQNQIKSKAQVNMNQVFKQLIPKNTLKANG